MKGWYPRVSMTLVFRIALVVTGIGALGVLGCKSSSNASGRIGRPKAIDRYIQAVHNYQSGDRDRAIRQLVEAMRQNPQLIMPRIMLGDLYRDQGKYPEAVAQYERVTRMDPYYASNWYKLGVGYHLSERLKDAAGSYQKALDLKPEDAKSNMNLGLVQLYLGHPEKALDYAKKATATEPRNAAAWSNLGITLDAMGDYAGAEEAYRKSIDLDPDSAPALINLAINLMAQDKAAEAAEIMKRVVSLNDSPAMRKRYGDALAKAGRYDQAIQQYHEALKQNPDYYPAMNEIGYSRIAEYRKGFQLQDAKRADALANWKQSLAVNPNQPKIQSAVKEWSEKTQNLIAQ